MRPRTLAPARVAGPARSLVALLAAWTLGSCGRPESNAAPETSGAWRGAVPVLEVGAGVDPETPFTNVSGIVPREEGGFLVANFQAPPVVRAFGADGALKWEVGGAGEGPGEFGVIFTMFPLGEGRVAAYDPALGRVTFLRSADGAVDSVTTITAFPDPRGSRGVVLFGAFDDGSFLGRPNGSVDLEPHPDGRSTTLAFRLAADGSVLDTLGAFPDMNPDWLFSTRLLTVAAGRHFVTAEPVAYALDVRDITGTLVRRVEVPWTPVPVTRARLEAEEERQLDRWRGRPGWESAAERILERFAAEPVQETLPPFAFGAVFADRRVWVQDYPDPTAEHRTWRGIDPDGVLPGEVLHTPSELELRAATADALYVSWTDAELGVVSVRVYERSAFTVQPD